MPDLDHLIYGAPVLSDAVGELAGRLGVEAGGGGSHPGLGTHNAVLSLGGERYLEIAAPDPEQIAPAEGLPFDLDTLAGPGLVGWVARCDDLASCVRRARERGIDLGEISEGRRKTPDGGSLHWWATTSTAWDGLGPFLIEWDDGHHPSRVAPRGANLLSFRLEHPSPAPVTSWLSVLGLEIPVAEGPQPAMVAEIRGPAGTVELR